MKVRLITASTVGGLEAAINEFLEGAASLVSVSVQRVDSWYMAFVGYTEAEATTEGGNDTPGGEGGDGEETTETTEGE